MIRAGATAEEGVAKIPAPVGPGDGHIGKPDPEGLERAWAAPQISEGAVGLCPASQSKAKQIWVKAFRSIVYMALLMYRYSNFADVPQYKGGKTIPHWGSYNVA